MLKSEDFATAVASHRPFVLKLAVNQLGDKAVAEDAVQETLLAALAGAARFEQRASLKTWLLSILKYKIIDAIQESHVNSCQSGRLNGRGPHGRSL